MFDKNYEVIKSSNETGTVVKKDDRIIKWANQPNVMKRIKDQTMRQIHAHEMGLLLPVHVPKVFKITDAKDLYMVEMETAKGARSDTVILGDNFFEQLRESLLRRFRIKDIGFIQNTKDFLKKHSTADDLGLELKKMTLQYLSGANDVCPTGFSHGDMGPPNISYNGAHVFAYDFGFENHHTTLFDLTSILSEIFSLRENDRALNFIFSFDEETNKQTYITFLANELKRHKESEALGTTKQNRARFEKLNKLILSKFKFT